MASIRKKHFLSGESASGIPPTGKNPDRKCRASSLQAIQIKRLCAEICAFNIAARSREIRSILNHQADDAVAPPALQIMSSDTPPGEAYVSVPYKNRWSWIADTDIRSKYTFAFVMLLFSISDTGVRGPAPVVTVPAN